MENGLPNYKRCTVCERLYWPIKSDQKYCNKCRGEVSYHKRKPLRWVPCKTCKKMFKTYRSIQKFCSDQCRYEFHAKKIKKNKNCLYCGRAFTVTNKSQQYCRLQHYIKAKRKRDHENYLKKREEKNGTNNS